MPKASAGRGQVGAPTGETARPASAGRALMLGRARRVAAQPSDAVPASTSAEKTHSIHTNLLVGWSGSSAAISGASSKASPPRATVRLAKRIGRTSGRVAEARDSPPSPSSDRRRGAPDHAAQLSARARPERATLCGSGTPTHTDSREMLHVRHPQRNESLGGHEPWPHPRGGPLLRRRRSVG
jgi:hypothetical protein